MQHYDVPLNDMLFSVSHVVDYHDLFQLNAFDSCNHDLIAAILDQAAKFACQELLPLNHSGDQQGSKLSADGVVTPEGFKEAYQQFVEQGWNGIGASTEFGGQGMPQTVTSLVAEMWSSANMAWALCPLLTHGAIEALSLHGSDTLKETYLASLISGKYSGTMCLTEPQAGSDVGAVTTKAVKHGDDYKISGQKIYITYGDHDMAENIIHLVLARLPDAPEGYKGISLFLVPKIMPDGSANELKAISLEHKLGIHASPTCVMSFGDNDGAVGYLVGQENKGLNHMFTMMNNARLAVGIEGLAMMEAAFCNAQAYANERVQGRIIGEAADSQLPIAHHPDVQRMLQKIKSQSDMMRHLVLQCSYYSDLAHHGDEDKRSHYHDLVSLLIPIIKAHGTDHGFLCASEAVQVFGGIGYVEETGVAQLMRDARIAMIYEGTNGIQANDLVFRKLVLQDGGVFDALIDDLTHDLLRPVVNDVLQEVKIVIELTLQALHEKKHQKVAYVAYDLLHAMSYCLCGIMAAKQYQAALVVSEKEPEKAEFCAQKEALSLFYMHHILPQAYAHTTSAKHMLEDSYL